MEQAIQRYKGVLQSLPHPNKTRVQIALSKEGEIDVIHLLSTLCAKLTSTHVHNPVIPLQISSRIFWYHFQAGKGTGNSELSVFIITKIATVPLYHRFNKFTRDNTIL